MKILAIIPSRFGSERFPGKPLSMILDRPMIQHVYERALKCSSLSGVYVATDDKRIYRAVRDFGGDVIMTSREHPTGTDRVAEAAKILEAEDEDLIINIQGDQPVFEPEMLNQLIDAFGSDEEIIMATLMCRLEKETDIMNPNHVKVVSDSRGFALFFSRSPIPYLRDRSLSVEYYKHLGFYAYRMNFLRKYASLPAGYLERAEKLEQLRVLENGYPIKVIKTEYDSIEIDTPEDIKEAENILRSSERNDFT